MKAIVFDDDGLRLEDVPEPVPGPGEVAVGVAYAGVQWADVLIREGFYPVQRPFRPGFEASGKIIAVGQGVDETRIGESVAALTMGGAYAEVVVVPDEFALAIDLLSPRQAAAFGWGAPTAFDLVNTVGQLRTGESILIHAAAGGVGVLAAQFAKAAGADRVVGVVGTDSKIAYAKRFGCDDVVVGPDFASALKGQSFDLVLDSIGGETRRQSLDLLAFGGRLLAYGNAGGDDFSASTADLNMTAKAVIGYSSVGLAQAHPDRLVASARRALDAIAADQVILDVTAEYELAAMNEAVQRMSKRSTVGKAVVRVG
jgi:NADPH:quinone reductase-like Zn-dependent oxidoreductase